MRKLVLIIIILAIPSFCLFSDGTPDAVPLLLIGHINTSTQFSVSLDGSLPFDIESNAVQPTGASETQISGIRIGSFSLKTSGSGFNLYVLHDKLQLTDRVFGTDYQENGNAVYDPGTKENIDYRLYMETSVSGSFLSCKSSSQANLSGYSSLNNPSELGDYIRLFGNSVDINNLGIYVVLEDEDTVASELKAGLYSSTIYFYMVI